MIKTAKNLIALARISAYMGAATGEPGVGEHGSPLQFQNETRSKNFSLKHRGYCFLQMLRNYTDQNLHNFYWMCYIFWIIYSGFSFFWLHKENESFQVGRSEKDRHLTLDSLKSLFLWTSWKKTTMNERLNLRL